ncbi:insulinase family protein [Marinobacter sp. X15-166B]|uniref:insulinase family protein n=1 Tax=Marinobacter sp. X15-166B TaxID=1897620 RepID=UPI00085C1A70|nr:insulinase family protein [Marinobacter sp. X15-166B]OEY65036.1 peptidase M16 [Marinobacter sp. X15-166B]
MRLTLSPAWLGVRNTLSGFMVLLLLSVQSVSAAQTPVKSPNDSNAYRYLVLDNDLKVLLVSSPGADKAAASLDIAVGSGDDPADREGLSHFLEHMLFLGTEKYPESGEYQQFIKSHGGSHNAFTAFQDTNYFFDVQADSLEAALDRFAQQFSAPLFTAEYVDRERRAVHSEYSSKLKDDGRRFFAVKKAIANPQHSFSQFAVGNLSTLDNTDERPLRDDLVEFWQRHYSANLMTLTVYGPQSLDTLEAMVRPRFSRIENRHLSARQYTVPMFAKDRLPALLKVASVRDIRRLSLSFPIPSQREAYQNKPASYVANLVGHEGPGSLLDVLKRAGLVESLSAGTGLDTGYDTTFEITMTLTAEGLERQQEILTTTFAYFDLLTREGINRSRFDEMQALADIDFRFREREAPTHQVTALSMQLQRVAPRDVLRAPWMMQTYVPEQYQHILNQLTPDNVLVSVLAQQPLEQPETEPWYGTVYTLEPLTLDGRATASAAPLVAQLALPEPNPFVPEQLALVAGDTMTRPVQLNTSPGFDIWYARDTQFETPKANVYLSLRTPATMGSARNRVLAQLFVDTVNANLNAWAYPAHLAGLNYSVYPHLRGITIRVGGYSDKLATLMTRVLSQVATPRLSPQRFEIARRNLVDSLRNKAKAAPVRQASTFIQSALLEGAWTTAQQLDAAEAVSFADLQAFAATLLTEVDPVMLAHGNLTEASALNIAHRIESLVLADSNSVHVARSGIRMLPPGESAAVLDVTHPDTGYTLYLQGDNSGFAERARFRLLKQLTSAPFFETLRTQQQLGYLVYATSFEMLEVPALAFVVQSPEATAEQIDEAVTAFAERFEASLAALSADDLRREQQAVVSNLLKQDQQLGDISGRYWREIDRDNQAFDSREQLADAVRQVTKEQLLATYRAAVLKRQRALKVTTSETNSDSSELLARLRNGAKVPVSP